MKNGGCRHRAVASAASRRHSAGKRALAAKLSAAKGAVSDIVVGPVRGRQEEKQRPSALENK